VNFLVIGSGSIGRRHASNLLKLGHKVVVQSVFLADQSLIIDGVRLTVTKKARLLDFDAVIIANLTSQHIEFALKCAVLKLPVFVEKPLSNNLTSAYEFAEMTAKQNLVIEAGFMLHAHPQVALIKYYLQKKHIGGVFYVRAAVGQWLPEWRPDRDYKTGYAADKNKGGGVLLDLIHEVELVQSLFGKIQDKKIYRIKCDSLEIETESIATVNGLLENGAICHIEMDYIRRNYKRELEIIGDLGSIYWDYSIQRVTLSVTGKKDVIHDISDSEMTRNDMYLDHMQHFISRVKNPNIKPLSSLASSIAALETTLENS
jgi:predicted dehydrogenase